ncbi:hypothetical protein AB0C90_39555 [Streptomyces sp. NPDC048550]|uniref:hypothetical protein n=1 Tax=Streptomyces sp. NPDC048550 TaxID=3155739 RepID=UPI0034424C7E
MGTASSPTSTRTRWPRSRRRDLAALLDRHVPLGPNQAARRLGVRRVDFDQVVRLGWVAPAGSVEID